jgi:predicted acylesterase/phospholipase RssA
MTDRASSPTLQDCDLIMKGGITSGIVYPSAILRLKERYRFRNIGGASAGAIGAAFAAAAELGRDAGGFEHLAARRDQLATGMFLKDLFQPSERTRPLLDSAYDGMLLHASLAAARREKRVGTGKWATRRFVVLRLVRMARRNVRAASTRGALVAVACAAGLAVLAAGCVALAGWIVGLTVGWGAAALGALLMLLVLSAFVLPLGALAGGAGELARRMAADVPENFFGLCDGGPGVTGQPGLTAWMHESIQELAGRAEGPPLTFGDLARAKDGIQLRMMTTNLSHNQGYQLPDLGGSLDAPAGSPHIGFAFREAEFRRLFPAPVVDAMTVAPARELDGLRLPDGYFALPRGPDLPVVVATRMSLSFPVLVSAVPLYTVEREAVDRLRGQKATALLSSDLQRNWFSDGGIASNFPIHFFDNWLPGAPTFGIQLTDLPPESLEPAAGRSSPTVSGRYVSAVTGATPVRGDGRGSGTERAVYLPRSDEVIEPEWHPISDWGSFASAIFTTLHDAHDNMQSSLPGYRDRIVQIRLASDEGGLNLTMPERTIEQVMAKGAAAGERILDYFDMNQHRWVRFQVLMSELERNLGLLEQRLSERRFDADAVFAAAAQSGYPYPRSCAWCDDARIRLEDLRAVARKWGSEGFFRPDSPPPPPVLRAVPSA